MLVPQVAAAEAAEVLEVVVVAEHSVASLLEEQH
jgi:hypothetical protein